MRKKYPPQQLHIESHDSQGLRLHIPVLLEAVLALLQPQKGESYLDLTAGYGGHAGAIIEQTGSSATLVDRDENAIRELQSFQQEGSRLLHTDFLSAARQLVDEGQMFDMILIDLGVSSPQLDNTERGFSFRNDAPLDMRMDQRIETSAATLVNTLSSEDLVKIITRYGEEPIGQARRIAQAIVESRPLETTGQLAEVIKKAYRGKMKRIHPATRTFQAIRIAVNDELQQVEKVLPLLPNLLNKDGRVAIITFHSLEDRLVKRYLKEQVDAGYEATLTLINKKPILGATEDVHNPRSRSAKLRAAVKINI